MNVDTKEWLISWKNYDITTFNGKDALYYWFGCREASEINDNHLIKIWKGVYDCYPPNEFKSGLFKPTKEREETYEEDVYKQLIPLFKKQDEEEKKRKYERSEELQSISFERGSLNVEDILKKVKDEEVEEVEIVNISWDENDEEVKREFDGGGPAISNYFEKKEEHDAEQGEGYDDEVVFPDIDKQKFFTGLNINQNLRRKFRGSSENTWLYLIRTLNVGHHIVWCSIIPKEDLTDEIRRTILRRSLEDKYNDDDEDHYLYDLYTREFDIGDDEGIRKLAIKLCPRLLYKIKDESISEDLINFFFDQKLHIMVRHRDYLDLDKLQFDAYPLILKWQKEYAGENCPRIPPKYSFHEDIVNLQLLNDIQLLHREDKKNIDKQIIKEVRESIKKIRKTKNEQQLINFFSFLKANVWYDVSERYNIKLPFIVVDIYPSLIRLNYKTVQKWIEKQEVKDEDEDEDESCHDFGDIYQTNYSNMLRRDIKQVLIPMWKQITDKKTVLKKCMIKKLLREHPLFFMEEGFDWNLVYNPTDLLIASVKSSFKAYPTIPHKLKTKEIEIEDLKHVVKQGAHKKNTWIRSDRVHKRLVKYGEELDAETWLWLVYWDKTLMERKPKDLFLSRVLKSGTVDSTIQEPIIQ